MKSPIRRILEAAARFVDAQAMTGDNAVDAMREAEADYEVALADYLKSQLCRQVQAPPTPQTLIEAQELGL
jgi:hypothetical protein